MIALRRSAYGRRLTAMKNSPAACATLGMNVVRLKLSVFMISAAIAGLGGCLFAQEIGAVTSDRFSLFESMTMLMLLVVAGAGYVSGGLTAGLLYGAVFVALENIFTKIGQDYTAFQGWSAWLVQFTALLPALIGIGLGRNPSGFLSDVFAPYGADDPRGAGRVRRAASASSCSCGSSRSGTRSTTGRSRSSPRAIVVAAAARRARSVDPAAYGAATRRRRSRRRRRSS